MNNKGLYYRQTWFLMDFFISPWVCFVSPYVLVLIALRLKLKKKQKIQPCMAPGGVAKFWGALVFKGGYHAQVQKHGKRVVFQGEASKAQAVFRVSKTAKSRERVCFFRLIKIWDKGMFLTIYKYRIRVWFWTHILDYGMIFCWFWKFLV